jgi:hypothetical protein
VGEVPPTRHSVERHDADVMSDEGAAGTSRAFHTPLDSRYSPTLDGAILDPVVPTAMHEPDVVHAVTRKGTEIPMDGTPVTCRTVWVVQLASVSALVAASTLNHHTLRTFAARLFIMVCVLS